MNNRLTEMRHRAGLTQEQLAERVGTGRSQIVKLERGERRMTVDWMVRLARELNCAPHDLLPGEGTDEPPAAVATATAAAPARPLPPALPAISPSSRLEGSGLRRDLPVCGAARGGADALFVDQGQPFDYVYRPAQLASVANAFAIYVVGDSMEPKFHAGDLVYLNPNLPLIKGCFVVVECGVEEAYIKQFVSRSNDGLRLREFNPVIREFDLDLHRITAIHRVVGSWEGR